MCSYKQDLTKIEYEKEENEFEIIDPHIYNLPVKIIYFSENLPCPISGF